MKTHLFNFVVETGVLVKTPNGNVFATISPTGSDETPKSEWIISYTDKNLDDDMAITLAEATEAVKTVAFNSYSHIKNKKLSFEPREEIAKPSIDDLLSDLYSATANMVRWIDSGNSDDETQLRYEEAILQAESAIEARAI